MADEHEQPDDLGNPGDGELRDILQGLRRVAVVGISDREDRASHGIARFLIERGLDVVGVNPTLQEVLGRPVYPTLAAVPGEHVPVLLHETLEWLSPAAGEWFLDGTAGAGGHAAEIAARLGESGFLVCADADPKMVAAASGRLAFIRC